VAPVTACTCTACGGVSAVPLGVVKEITAYLDEAGMLSMVCPLCGFTTRDVPYRLTGNSLA